MDLRRLSVASPQHRSRIRALQLEKPLLRGESTYDYVVAILMAAVIGGALILGWIALIYFTNRAFIVSAPPTVTAVEIVYPKGTWEITREQVKAQERAGVLREDRWIFEFPEDQTEEEYARLSDTLGIELATPAGAKSFAYASHFTNFPTVRRALFSQDKRMYFAWSNAARQELDIRLLRKVGVRADAGSIVLQFLPDAVQERLIKLEHDYKGRAPAEICQTRFRVFRSGGSFDFEVERQEFLK